MKTLLLFRHAKSSHEDEGLEDHERPLNGRGRGDAPEMARRLAEAGLLPDRIVCSSARRARETADLFMRAVNFQGAFVEEPRLYHAAPKTIIAVAAEHGGDAERLMLVGHNPGFANLVHQLTGYAGPMPTAAIAQITLSISHWSEAASARHGELVALLRPKDEK